MKQSLSLCGIWYTELIHVWGWWYSQEYKMYSVMFRKIYLQWNFIVNFLIFKVEDFYFYLFKLFPKISCVQKIIFLLLPNIRSFACTEFHLEWLYHAFDHHHSNFFIFVIAKAEYCFWQDRLYVGLVWILSNFLSNLQNVACLYYRRNLILSLKLCFMDV